MDAGEENSPIEPGTLLVAAPRLIDGNFRRTVVYVIEHQDSGTLGVVLNRPSEVAVHDVLPGWAPHVSKPQAVYVGGPVEQKTAICLAALRTGEDVATMTGVIGVRGPVTMVDLDANPEELVAKVRGLRVFAGYAGWDAGQLDRELERGDWMVVPALPEDVLTPSGVDLWGQVLRRQGMPMALLASHPGDVGVN